MPVDGKIFLTTRGIVIAYQLRMHTSTGSFKILSHRPLFWFYINIIIEM